MGLSAKNLHPWPRLETPGGERECGAPPLEPGNWWASSSSLRSRFSPPPPRSFSLPLVPHRDRRQKAIVPPRISPLPTHLFSPPAKSRRAYQPYHRGGLPDLLAPSQVQSTHPPSPPPKFSPLSPVQSNTIRAVSIARRRQVRVGCDRLAGAILIGVVDSSGQMQQEWRGYLGFLIATGDAGRGLSSMRVWCGESARG